MASGHSATGALAGGLVAPLLPSPVAPAAAVAFGMAAGAYLALVMDLDTKGKAYYLLQPFSWVLKPLFVWISKLLFHLTRGPGDPDSTNGHRMFTHQPAFAGLLGLLALWLSWDVADWRWWFAGVVFVGVLSHRWGDACTESGVPPGLVHVIVRMVNGEHKVWATVGVPRRLRFVTGGGKRKIGFKSKSRKRLTIWDATGEAVLTYALVGLSCLLGLATVAGWYPIVLS
jgi:membrane-bound metal-dependent hydrolase YbcI (DUF457 family)